MTVPLRRLDDDAVESVVGRRLKAETGGLGWLAALDYRKKKQRKVAT